MTLRLTLAGLLVLALACGGGESTPTPEGDPPPPPPPAADGAGGDEGAEQPLPEKPEGVGSLTKDLVEGADAEEGEGSEDIEWQTKEISTTVKLPPAQRKELKKTGGKLLEAEAKKQGYDSVTKVKLGKPSCDGEWCTATVTGEARRAVKKEAAEGEAAEGEAKAE